MIAVDLVFPTFMRLVYPSRLGKVHTWVLGVYRKCALPEQGHSRSIRIDLEATATSADDDLGVGVGHGDGDGNVDGESSQDGAELHQLGADGIPFGHALSRRQIVAKPACCGSCRPVRRAP